MKATGRPPGVLRREGWSWDEIYQAAGVEAIRAGLEREAAARESRG